MEENNQKAPFSINELSKKIIENGKLSNTLSIRCICEPTGFAYNIAKEINDNNNVKMEANQLRKIYDRFVNLKELCNNKDINVKDIEENLYGIVPLIAYSVGRELCPKSFYILIESCINSIGNNVYASDEDYKNDVYLLIKLIESIIAFDKYIKIVNDIEKNKNNNKGMQQNGRKTNY